MFETRQIQVTNNIGAINQRVPVRVLSSDWRIRAIIVENMIDSSLVLIVNVHELQLALQAILDKHGLNAVRTRGYYEYDDIVDVHFSPVNDWWIFNENSEEWILFIV